MAWQGWRGRGWHSKMIARQGRQGGRGGQPRLPVHSSCQRCCLRLPSPSLFLVAQMVLTLCWALFAIINSVCKWEDTSLLLAEPAALLAVRFFKPMPYLSPSSSLLFLPGSFMALGWPPPHPPFFFLPPCSCPEVKSTGIAGRRPQLREGS